MAGSSLTLRATPLQARAPINGVEIVFDLPDENPIALLNGPQEAFVLLGEQWTDPGAYGLDKKDGIIANYQSMVV